VRCESRVHYRASVSSRDAPDGSTILSVDRNADRARCCSPVDGAVHPDLRYTRDLLSWRRQWELMISWERLRAATTTADWMRCIW